MRERPRDHSFEKARERLSSELDVVKILRRLRLLKIACKQSHSADTVTRMKEKARLTSLDDDSSKNELELAL